MQLVIVGYVSLYVGGIVGLGGCMCGARQTRPHPNLFTYEHITTMWYLSPLIKYFAL